MNGSPPPPAYPYQTPPRSSSGGSCFLKGCLILVVLVMLLGIVIGGTGWYLYASAKPFLTSELQALPTFQGGPAAEAATGQKLAAFNQTIAAGQRAAVSLTGDDLNVLVARDPQLSKYRDRVYLSIVNNQIVVETSFPMVDDRSLPPGQRLYANARFVLDASYSSGDFAFQLARFETLAGRQPSPFLLSVVKWYVGNISTGFNRSFHDQPEKFGDLQQLTAQIHTIIIQNNQVVATSVDHPKPAAAPVAVPPEPR